MTRATETIEGWRTDRVPPVSETHMHQHKQRPDHCTNQAQQLLPQISQTRIDPPPLTSSAALPDVLEKVFLSYNAGRLREACQILVKKMLADDAVVGMSVSGALTPAGLGMSCLVPLIEAGFIDWIVSTGANLYH